MFVIARGPCIVPWCRRATFLFGCAVAQAIGVPDTALGATAGAVGADTSPAQVADQTLVFIPDDALRWVVTGTCWCGRDTPLTAGDMRTLEQLNIGPGVVNLSGLEFATNLKSLTIVAPKVSSLEPLRGMQKLEWLRLGDTAVADFSPLSELIALESLYWSDPDVSDLGPLANLRNITFIELSNTGVSDIEPLRNSTRLRTLYLTDSPVSDVGPLSGLTQLTRLYLTGTSVSDLNPLRGLIDLRGIALTGSQVTDLEPLSELIELTWLGLGDTPVSDLGPLSRLVNLEQITLDNAQLTSLAPLADMRKLRRLSAKNAPQKHPPWDRGVECRWRPELPIAPRFRNAISDVAALEGLTGLEWIDLSNNRISTLPPLAALAELRSLWLSGNRIASIAGLEGLSRLDVLDLTDNAVSNLEPLTGILGLYSLYLNGNDISDLAPLAGMKRLSALYLNDNKISTLEPLAHLSLWRLDLGNNRVSDLAELGQLPRQLYLEDNDITDLSPLLPYLPDSRDWDPLRIDVRRNPLDERSGEIARQDSSIFTEDDHGDSPGDATVLDLGTTVEGRLDVEHDVDYFRMRVTEPTAVEIFALQKDLLVYHGRDTLVARGDWISETLPPGTYYVSLSSDCYWNGFDGPESADVKHRGPYVLRTTVPTTVDIPDSNLRAALRDAIASRVGQEVDPITASAMSTLRYVEAARAEIADLTGIEHAGNAADLDISENVISDLQPLVGMSRLLGLDASDNAIADFSPLAGLKDLRRLDLSRNASSDLHPLAHLEDLTRLYLSGNAASDLSPLAGLTRLWILDLSGNAVSDLSPLAESTRLRWLNLRSNEISDIEPLLEAVWPRGAWIDLRGNPLNPAAVNLHVPMLEAMGVTVRFRKDDHGSGWDEATLLQPGMAVSGRDDWDEASGSPDLDYFHFEITEPAFVHLSVTSQHWEGLSWELLDSGGRTLFRSRERRLYRASVRRRLQPGLYRILVDPPFRQSYNVQVLLLSAPGNLQVERDGSQATVSWESTYPASANIGTHAYIVVAVPAGGGPERSCWTPTNVHTCVVSGLSEGVDYEFTVREVGPRGMDAAPVSAPVGTLAPRSFLRGWRLRLLDQRDRERVTPSEPP